MTLALDTSEGSRPPLTAEQVKASLAARRERYGRREAIRGVHETTKANCCGLYGMDETIRITTKNGRCSASGLMLCGRVWTCPVCSCIIGTRRANEMTEALTRHMESGGGLMFATLTMRRIPNVSLAHEYAILSKAWGTLVSSRWFKQTMWAQYQFVGHIKALEVVFSFATGWGPHYHLALLTDAPLDINDYGNFWSELQEKWTHHVNRLDPSLKPGDGTGRLGVGVHLEQVCQDEVSNIVGYLVKDSMIGFVAELAHSEHKKGRGESLGVFDLAEKGAKGDSRCLEKWHEYEHAIKAKQRLRWSKGLRSRLGLDEDDKTDDELLLESEHDEEVTTLDKDESLLLVAIPEVTPMVLEAAERGGAEEVHKVMAAMIASLSWAEISRLRRWGSDRFGMREKMYRPRKALQNV